MSENKTEKPTKQRLKKAKERAEAAKSSFLAGSLVFVGAILLIWGLRRLLTVRFQESMRAAFFQLNEQKIEGAFFNVFNPLIFPLIVTLFGILVIASAAHIFQTGWVWSTEQIRPKWRKKKGERRFFLPLLQFISIAVLGYLAVRITINPNLLFSSPGEQAACIFRKQFFLAIEIGAVLLFLGLCDFFYQKWRHYKRMHMTSEEKKQEQRENEGDPNLKRRLRDRRD